MQYLAAYAVTALVFLALDMIWLGYVARDLYRAEMGSLLADPINMPAATAFYLVYVAGLVFFAVLPGLEASSIMRAAALGAVLGFLAYATYDLTGLAVIRGFSAKLALIDMAWGAVVSALAASAGTFVALKF